MKRPQTHRHGGFRGHTSQDSHALIREYVSLLLAPEAPPISRARQGGLLNGRSRARADLGGFFLSEEYVSGVLGIDRGGMLVEGFTPAAVSQVVLMEHLIFEGFWSDAFDSTKKFLKDNPVSNAIEAVKKAKNDVEGLVVALSSIVMSGGDAISTVVSGAKSLMQKGLVAIKKSIGSIVKRIKELAGKVTIDSIKSALESIAGGMAQVVDKVVGIIESATGGGGWKAMLTAIACFLAVVAVREKVGKLASMALNILSGNAKKMMDGALQLKQEIEGAIEATAGDDEEEGDLDVEKEIEDAEKAGAGAEEAKAEGMYLKAVSILAGAVKGFVWKFVKKIIGAAGVAAVEQLAGPIGWIKKLAEMFDKVAGGISWVSEKIMDAIQRASFRPNASGGGSAPT